MMPARAVNHRAHRADRIFVVLVAGLLLFGLLILMLASAPVGYAKFQDAYWFVKRQLLFGVVPGLALFLLFAKIDYHRLAAWRWVLYGGTLMLLLAVFVPGVGAVVNGSRSWLRLGGYNFQPAELAKLTTVVVLAYWLAQTDSRRAVNWYQPALRPLLAAAPVCLLILLQPDVGTLSIVALIIFALLYLARLSWRVLVGLGLAVILGFGALVLVAPYRVERLTTFLHPELDPRGVGYQINQSFLAIGSGGIWGLGLGHSRQKYQYLPEVNADSIFAIIAEEMGLVGSVGLVGGLVLLGWRGLRIAKAAPDTFGTLLAGGIMVWLVAQSFLNIGGMVGALPLTGVPLPFISHGGSALLTALAGAGMVAGVSKFSRV